MNLNLRPARPRDAPTAASLIYSTGPQSFDIAFGSPQRAIRIIARLFTKENTITSYRYSTVAELERRVVGVLLLLDDGISRRLQLSTGKELIKIVGPLFILFRLPIFTRQSAASLGPHPGELYIANIAVVPYMQGHGIGRMLMKAAEDKAKKKGYIGLSLCVKSDNYRAIDFYRGLEYKCGGSTFDPWLWKRHGITAVLRMSKRI